MLILCTMKQCIVGMDGARFIARCQTKEYYLSCRWKRLGGKFLQLRECFDVLRLRSMDFPLWGRFGDWKRREYRKTLTLFPSWKVGFGLSLGGGCFCKISDCLPRDDSYIAFLGKEKLHILRDWFLKLPRRLPWLLHFHSWGCKPLFLYMVATTLPWNHRHTGTSPRCHVVTTYKKIRAKQLGI